MVLGGNGKVESTLVSTDAVTSCHQQWLKATVIENVQIVFSGIFKGISS